MWPNPALKFFIQTHCYWITSFQQQKKNHIPKVLLGLYNEIEEKHLQLLSVYTLWSVKISCLSAIIYNMPFNPWDATSKLSKTTLRACLVDCNRHCNVTVILMV